jgi:hypothetical protein
MKKKIFFLILTAALIILIFPISSLNAEQVDFMENGDFESGIFDPWQEFSSAVIKDGYNWVARLGLSDNSWIGQDVSVPTKNLNFSFSFKPVVFTNNIADSEFAIYLKFYKNGVKVGDNLLLTVTPGMFAEGFWQTANTNIKGWYQIVYGSALPDIDMVSVNASYIGSVENYIYFDDFMLVGDVPRAVKEEPVIRTMPMTCWQVWVNEDNNFQFIFWYAYEDKNFVRIYDMEGNMVFEVDLPGNDPNLIVDLPDGMYTVKTFHDQELLQEFIIGKS